MDKNEQRYLRKLVAERVRSELASDMVDICFLEPLYEEIEEVIRSMVFGGVYRMGPYCMFTKEDAPENPCDNDPVFYYFLFEDLGSYLVLDIMPSYFLMTTGKENYDFNMVHLNHIDEQIAERMIESFQE